MKKGFSLIEIVCVLAMTCIMVSILTPVLSTFVKQNQLNTATDVLINDLRHAKMLALSRNQTVITVFFTLDEKNENYIEYYIYDTLNQGQKVIRRVKMPNRIVISKKDSTFSLHKVTFTKHGGVTPNACTITLEDLDTGRKNKITLTIGFTRIMKVSG